MPINIREKGRGRIIAEMCDYWMALQIVEEPFRENMGANDIKTEKYLKIIAEKGRITPCELAKLCGVLLQGGRRRRSRME